MVLLDTGSERSVVKAAHSQRGIVTKGQTMKFQTPSGTFSSEKVTELEFALNEFSESRQVRWKFNVLPEDSKLPYNMIIGRDFDREQSNLLYYSYELAGTNENFKSYLARVMYVSGIFQYNLRWTMTCMIQLMNDQGDIQSCESWN